MATAYEKAVNFWQRIATVLSPKTAGDSLLLDLTSGSYFNIRYPWAAIYYEIFKIVAGAHPGTLQILGEMIYELNLHANGLATTNFPYIRWQQGLGGPPDILFEITASHPVTPSSAELRLTGGVLSLKDSYLAAAINLSQTGTAGLVGFTATSIIAALNELLVGLGGKENTLTKGNLTAGSTKISIGGTGTNALIGAGASVDVNEGNLTLNNIGGILGITKGGTSTSSTPTNGQLLIGKADNTYAITTLTAGANINITNGDGAITIASTASGGGDKIIGRFWAGDFDYFETNMAPLDLDVGVNISKVKRMLQDDTTEEFNNLQLYLPSDLVGTETIYIDIYGYAVAAAVGKNVQEKFYHSARHDGETWDAAYANKTSGDVAVSGVQDTIDKITISDTASNLGWVAGDIVWCQLSRIVAGANNLVGDYAVICVVVRRG